MHPIELTLPAPAKINLCLRIVGRRPDGYHLLDSIVLPISLCDDIRISCRLHSQSIIRVTADNPAVPSGPDNLAYQAAQRLLDAVKCSATVDIHLIKRIPAGTGLGGGSSDAATVLVALNRTLGCPLADDALARIAASIGADVPFFIAGTPARMRGIGDHLLPVEIGGSLPLVVCWDGQPLSTALVYSRMRTASLTTSRPISNIADFVSGRVPLSAILVNDLEAAAAEIHPNVLLLKEELVNQGALGALMTGSGSAVFGVWPNWQAAQQAASCLRGRGLWAEAVHTLDRSPILEN